MSPMDRLIATFRTALNLPDGVDVRQLEYNRIKEWDSVGHMALVGALEEAFDIMLETDDVLDMSSFDKAVEILEKNGVVFDA